MTSIHTLRRPTFTLALVGVLTLLSVHGAAAQTTGRLRGQVTDDGKPLPGASVTVTSDDLIGGSRFAVTGENGTYSFAALPVGDYAVKAELDGFQSQQTENVRVSLNGVATVNFALPSAFSDEVVVTGEAPLVQLSRSSSDTTYNADFIENLPLTRYYWDMMAVSPGVSLTFADNTNAIIAYGSGASNHNWQIDGLNSGSIWLGASFVYMNPDTIEEVQVIGVGATAEFGNMTGAAMNVVTKSGGNDVEGRLSAFFQDDSLTDANVTLEDDPFPEFTREEFTDVTLTVGGPFKKDKAWYFVAGQYFRDSAVQPGVDPSLAPVDSADRFDAKLTFRFSDSSTGDVKIHADDWSEAAQGNPAAEPSNRSVYAGDNPAGSLNFGSVLSDRSFLELKYAFWESEASTTSATGSTEPAKIVVDSVNGLSFEGGIFWPGVDVFDNDQVSATLSHFAEGLLGGDHDFKFGIHYSEGSKVTTTAPGPQGAYYASFIYSHTDPTENYYYKYYQLPYQYGSEIETLAAFVDDSWQVNDKLTITAGVRMDSVDAVMPELERLDINFNGTGGKIPGIQAFDVTTVSPRFGFAYNPDGRTVIRGSAGIYRDKLISAHWDAPPPQVPPFLTLLFNPATGQFEGAEGGFSDPDPIDPDAEPIRSLQFSLGFERQFKTNMSYGVLAVYKDTDKMIGWEILDDGVYEPFDWVNPATGETQTLFKVIEKPTVRKGNGPGFTVLGPDTDYYQEYEGLVFTFNRRHADGWSMRASYTLSESRGLIPNYSSNFQNNGLFTSRVGTDPNDWLNADQLLQGDRRHMFRLQANFDLPWNLALTTSINLQDGRAHSEQAFVSIPGAGRRTLTLVPANDGQRFDTQKLVDVALGRIFDFGGRSLRVDLQAFNLLNDDAVDRWVNLRSIDRPRAYVYPRRLMLRFSFDF